MAAGSRARTQEWRLCRAQLNCILIGDHNKRWSASGHYKETVASEGDAYGIALEWKPIKIWGDWWGTP